MPMDKVNTASDEKNLNENVNTKTETAFDIFGKSVAMQLKALSLENALLAQCRIQSILTEYGISDYRQRARYNSSMSNYSNQRSPSAFSEDTDGSFNNDDTSSCPNHNTSSIPVHRSDEYLQLSPPQLVYDSLDDGTSHITEVIYLNNNATVELDTCYENNDDAITAAMSATYDAMQKANNYC